MAAQDAYQLQELAPTGGENPGLPNGQPVKPGLESQYDLDTTLTQEVVIDEGDAGEVELGYWDVFSFIVNKMIGTGIFTGPVITYTLTRSKWFTLVLWIIGFIYSLVSTWLYLHYAKAFPYTGGELVYISEITSHRVNRPAAQHTNVVSRSFRWLSRATGDGLMAFLLYAILFLAVFNTSTNAMQVGRLLMVAIEPPTPDSPQPNGHIVRLIGVITLGLVCWLQWGWPVAGRKLNLQWAIGKIIVLIILIIFGAVHASQLEPSERQPWAMPDNTIQHNWSKALLAIVFSFEGWENATFVSGEIRDHKTLRKGFIGAVLTVGVLYIFVVLVFLFALPQNLDSCAQFIFPASFSGCSPSAIRGWAVIEALSSLGSINAIAYTFSRVKQSIGDAMVLPWSRAWRKDHEVESRGRLTGTTPVGGLAIHWVTSTIMIAGMSSVPDLLESVVIPGFIQTYTHAFILLTLAVFSFRIPSRWADSEPLPEPNMPPPADQVRSFPAWGLRVFIFWLYAIANGAILGFTPEAQIDADGTTEVFPGYRYPAITFSLMAFGILYYYSIFGSARTYYAPTARQIIPNAGEDTPEATKNGPLSRFPKASLLRLGRVKAEVRKNYRFDRELQAVRRFGRRWRIRYVMNMSKRHPNSEGRPNGPEVPVNHNSDPINFLYWFFGGRRWIEIDRTPYVRVQEWFGGIRDWIQEQWRNVIRRRP